MRPSGAQGNLFWGDVSAVVLDEADTMFDAGFGPEVRAVLGPLRSKPDPARVVLVVATLSKV
jgi:superfamily II DNA/RNA helicase